MISDSTTWDRIGWTGKTITVHNIPADEITASAFLAEEVRRDNIHAGNLHLDGKCAVA
jgi:hypothetical protein